MIEAVTTGAASTTGTPFGPAGPGGAAGAVPVWLSVNVHIGTDTPLTVHRTSAGRVWVEIGRADASVGLFLDRAGLARLLAVLGDAQDGLTLRAVA